MQNKIPRTYQMSQETIERVQRNAKQLECYPSVLVDLLLKRALDELEKGTWQLNRKPIIYRIDW